MRPDLEKTDEGYGRAMVVVAHPDDAEYSCSGTVARWVREGWEVTYVMCTDGSKGTSDRSITSEQLMATRTEEQKNAGKVLGLKDIAFLGHPDGYLVPSLDLRRDIAREIRRHRPGVLLCPYPIRDLQGPFPGNHPDHIAAGEAALAAVFPTARDHLTFPELLDDGFQPWAVREVWVIGHPSPDVFVDITEDFDTSVDALLQHASQMSMPEDEVRERMREWKRTRARGRGIQYAETFKRIKYRS
jgi:LmbE family N-acetylglucosaminyl deacetylase